MTDLLEYIKKMQEMYGDDVITTADKINRPEPKKEVKEIEAINEFVKRNPRADGGRIGFGPGGQAIKQKNLKKDYAKYGKDKLKEATKILLSDDFGRSSTVSTNLAIQDAKRLGLNTYEDLPSVLKAKIRNQISKYGRVIPESEARLLGRKKKTATDRAAFPTKGARIIKGNYTRDYSTLELKNLAEDGLYDPYKNKFAEGVPEKVLVKDRIVDIEFSDPETKKKFFEDFEKRFKYLRGSKQLKKLEIDNAGLYKKYLSNLEPKTAELALAGLRNSLIEKTIASGGDERKYFYKTMGIGEKGKSNIVRKERLDKAKAKAGKGVADILDAQDETVETLNKFYKQFPEELLGNTKLRNLLDLTLEDGEIVKKNKYVKDEDFLKLVKERPLFTKDHIDEVQFEKLSTEFPVFRQLATYNTNSGLIKSIKSYVAKNQNSKDPVVQDKIKKQIAFLEDLKLRVDTPTGRVGSKEVLAAVDRQAGILPNFLAQLRALNIKLPAKAKAVLLGTGGGLAATTLATAGPIEETGSTAIDTAKTAGAATAGALGVGTKPGRQLLGKAFRTLGTPLSGSLLAANQIRSNIQSGENVVDAVVDPLVGLELSFPGLFKENLAKITSNPTAQKILRLGKFGRALTPIGAGITAAGLGIDAAKFTKRRIDELRSMTPEQRAELRRQGEAQAFDPFQAAGGGLAKEAGDRSGPPPEKGPNSEGLPGLLKRVRNL
jgi:hypothetical protein